MPDDKPIHPHDCDRCVYLGRYTPEPGSREGTEETDLYYCPGGGPTVISRYGAEGAYKSGLCFGTAKGIPSLYEARKRAEARGFPVDEAIEVEKRDAALLVNENPRRGLAPKETP